jgi:hypothetical protein
MESKGSFPYLQDPGFGLIDLFNIYIENLSQLYQFQYFRCNLKILSVQKVFILNKRNKKIDVPNFSAFRLFKMCFLLHCLYGIR